MKRSILLCLIILVSLSAAASFVQAENFPASSPAVSQSPRIASPADRQKMFYGYVPPAPIRHTWPGGYRVIYNELTNTLIEHILGQY
ncbi:MAG TPA: hypothetical protein VK463_05695 [Desulfomonilaceae bacterium]|nr:hypothetical protein [Desulfomonilaceae bacterium]